MEAPQSPPVFILIQDTVNILPNQELPLINQIRKWTTELYPQSTYQVLLLVLELISSMVTKVQSSSPGSYHRG